jgi:hypothetical protein
MNRVKFIEADQTRLVYQYINMKRKLLRTYLRIESHLDSINNYYSII